MWLFALVTLSAAPDAGTPTPSRLVQQSREAASLMDYDGAVWPVVTCLDLEPTHVECTLALADALESRTHLGGAPSDSARATLLYRRFLDLAPPTDKRRARVERLLAAPHETPVVDGPLHHAERLPVPRSGPVVMPSTLRVGLGRSKDLKVSTLVKLTNDNPAAVDATLVDASTLRVRGRKRGVATLKLVDPDSSWHQLRVTVE